MRYYYRQHILGYRQVKAEGKTAWAEIHGHSGFENFSSRAFLEEALPRLRFSIPHPKALEYGCGTGPGACFLAERGFRVAGIDIIPLAIEMAKELAEERGLSIHYEVCDICDLPLEGEAYDLIVDSFCLQCVVLDEERARVFSGVRARLKPDGYYLISTAMFDEHRFREECMTDTRTGIVYHRYGEDMIIEPRSGTVYQRLTERPEGYDGALRIKGDWYLLHRRHLKRPALRAELEASGFKVLYQDEEYGGHVICALRNGIAAPLRVASGT